MDGKCYLRTVKTRKPKVTYVFFHQKTKKPVTDKELIEQLKAIKIPPTYTGVVLCPNPKKDLQGIGYDGTGRKQYFYSDAHKERSAKIKYCNLVHLGKKVQTIVRDINKLMNRGIQGEINQDIMDALALQVMILCNFRVGSRNNRDKYHTYGLTTITRKHVTFSSGSKPMARIKFTGKKQQINDSVITDPKTVKFLKRLKTAKDTDWKGKNPDLKPLFSYKGVTATPESLNDFLSQYSPDITTKTWRTWFANTRFIEKMFKVKEIPETKTARKRLVNDKIKEIADELHHTAAVNKRNYLIKELPELLMEHPDAWIKLKEKRRTPNSFMMEFLQGYCILYNGRKNSKAKATKPALKTKKAPSRKRVRVESSSESESSYSSSRSSSSSSSRSRPMRKKPTRKPSRRKSKK